MKEVFVVTTEIATDDGYKYKVEGVRSTMQLARELKKLADRKRQVTDVMIECFQVDEDY